MNDEDRRRVVQWRAEIDGLSKERHAACKAFALLEDNQTQPSQQKQKAKLTAKISSLDKQIADRREWIEKAQARRTG
jgi:hypothetical protein